MQALAHVRAVEALGHHVNPDIADHHAVVDGVSDPDGQADHLVGALLDRVLHVDGVLPGLVESLCGDVHVGFQSVRAI